MNPKDDRYWIDLDAALLHHLRQIPAADALLAVPANANEDDLNRKTTLLEHHPILPGPPARNSSARVNATKPLS